MDRLTLALLGPVAVIAAPVQAADLAEWRPHIVEAERRFDVPAAWIEAVLRAESAGDPVAVSPKGATGLMQIMPATWAELRAEHGLGADPFAPRDNILAGAAYLRAMHDLFGFPGLFAAYNAGPARYQSHLTIGDPLPAETVAYVARVTELIGQNSAPDASKNTPPDGSIGAPNAPASVTQTTPIPSGRGLFFTLGTTSGASFSASKSGLFVPLNPVADDTD
ncbi:lytic transglycosylase domain-containing protein [Rhodospira trueperi]|uniref:Transglycosylase SLT domain-containing protein n=1 Tax=Rhodospira trueperi TaxID=69960 RepID=A0A1G7I4G6_9PROT|nr:lytic transglycosylase domain-containing protein [Rhodospira trueperi]SDF07631.1 Transglycosylase SLT domain-containing protein [Rhodospira trueperi]